jgi:SAM-dependent methyltransferase
MTIYKFIRKNISKKYRRYLDQWSYNRTRKDWVGDKLHCPTCKSSLKGFIHLNDICDGIFLNSVELDGITYPPSQFETFNYENYMCPICGSADRARLYAHYFNQRLADYSEKIQVIHFAPDSGLREFLQKNPKIDYKTADLFVPNVDFHLDLRAMPEIETNSLDCIICSHVLEHIIEDELAMAELYRVLKPGGWGIMMVPIMMGLETTHEDPTILSKEARVKAYGVEDHVRMYEKRDYLAKLRRAGFSVKELGNDYFGDGVLKSIGVSSTSVLYVVEK